MRTYKFNRRLALPIIVARLRGRGTERKVKLIFDTGAAVTQFSTPIVEALGYSAVDGERMVSAVGPAGPIQHGYALHIDEIFIFGKAFSSPLVAAYDYDDFIAAEIDGLLGYDLIKEFHLEMDGPSGVLKIFNF